MQVKLSERPVDPGSARLGRTALVRFETQSLRSHSAYLFIKCFGLLFMPRGAGFLRIGLTQFVERCLDGELRGFGHGRHLQIELRLFWKQENAHCALILIKAETPGIPCAL